MVMKSKLATHYMIISELGFCVDRRSYPSLNAVWWVNFYRYVTRADLTSISLET